MCESLCFFFFQAEDGIRDLVRSRGLGDVYKRQVQLGGQELARAVTDVAHAGDALAHGGVRLVVDVDKFTLQRDVDAVSYTHLTLPTSDLV